MSMVKQTILSLKLQHCIFSLKYLAQYLIVGLIKCRPTLLQKVVDCHRLHNHQELPPGRHEESLHWTRGRDCLKLKPKPSRHRGLP